jgi:hypothetical protein
LKFEEGDAVLVATQTYYQKMVAAVDVPDNLHQKRCRAKKKWVHLMVVGR